MKSGGLANTHLLRSAFIYELFTNTQIYFTQDTLYPHSWYPLTTWDADNRGGLLNGRREIIYRTEVLQVKDREEEKRRSQKGENLLLWASSNDNTMMMRSRVCRARAAT